MYINIATVCWSNPLSYYALGCNVVSFLGCRFECLVVW